MLLYRNDGCDGYEGKGDQFGGKEPRRRAREFHRPTLSRGQSGANDYASAPSVRSATSCRAIASTRYRHERVTRATAATIQNALFVGAESSSKRGSCSKRGSSSSRGSSILGVLTSMAQRARALSITTGQIGKHSNIPRAHRKSRAASGVEAALAVKRRSVSAVAHLNRADAPIDEERAVCIENRSASGMLALPDFGSGRRHSSSPFVA